MTAATQPSQLSSPVVWHALTAEEVATRLDVDPAQGLTVEEARTRLGTYGPNAGSATFSNPKPPWAFAWAIVGSMLVTQTRVLQDLFHTTPLTGSQWALCLVPGVVLLIGGELFKIVLRSRRKAKQPTAAPVPAV